MLDIAKIEQIAKIYSPQELHAALAWQQHHQTFQEQACISELHQPPELWSSFFFMAPSDGFNWEAWSFDEVFKTLMTLACDSKAPDTQSARCALFPAHCLFRYTDKQEKIVAQMMLWDSRDGRPSLSLVPLSLKGVVCIETLDNERSTLLPW